MMKPTTLEDAWAHIEAQEHCIADLEAQLAEYAAQSDDDDEAFAGMVKIKKNLEAQLAHERNKCTMTKVCHWKESEEGHWFGKCGIGWTFNDIPSSPSEHRMRYCPQCGAEIIQHDYEQEKETTP